MRSPSSVFAAASLVLTSISVSAQQTTRSQNDPRPVAHATARKGSIVIDGKLDDAGWAAATPITDFSQMTPDEGRPASQRTELRFVYDESAIYIGARMYDSL